MVKDRHTMSEHKHGQKELFECVIGYKSWHPVEVPSFKSWALRQNPCFFVSIGVAVILLSH